MKADRQRGRASRIALIAGGLVLAALGPSLLLFGTLMTPTAADVRDFALYLALTGAAALVISWLAIEVLDRTTAPSLRTRAAVGAAIASLASLLSILVLAALMFVSTTHDLPLLIAVLVFAGVVASAVAYHHAGRIADRIEALTDLVERLVEGRYEPSANRGGDPSLDRLNANLDRLATRLAAAEKQREQVERERRELLASISHDLRTPLASVRASAEALADGLVPPDEAPRYFDRIERDINRLDGMIEDLFELAQLEAGTSRLRRTPVPILEVASDVVDAMQPLAAAGGVSLHLNVDCDPPTISLDGPRIQRAIANLLRNALEHTGRGGEVRVSVGLDDTGALVAVADTGDGIDRERLDHIWERPDATTLGDRGNGLGLAIVRGIVQAHGGHVDAASALGEGSTFTIRLPLADRPLPVRR